MAKTMEERIAALEVLLVPQESTLASGESGVLPPRTLGQRLEWLKAWVDETTGRHEGRLQALEAGCQHGWHKFSTSRFCPDCGDECDVRSASIDRKTNGDENGL